MFEIMLPLRSFTTLAVILILVITTITNAKSIIVNRRRRDAATMDSSTASANIKWIDDQSVLNLLKYQQEDIESNANTSRLFVLDTRSSNEYNGWKSFEKFDYNSDTVTVFSGHFKGASNFEIEWLFNFNESLITDTFHERIGLKPLSSSSDDNTTSYEILVYDTKLERLEAMRDYLLNRYRVSVLYLYKIIDKKVLYETMVSENATRLMEHEPNYNILVSPEYLYSIIFNPLAPSIRTLLNISTATTDTTTETPITTAGYKLFDVSYGDENQYYMQSHIPTSIHLDTNEFEEAPLWNRRNRTALIQLLADLGIKENNTESIILYGNPDPMAAYRLAVILKWLGVNKVHVLNGGYNAWLRRNFPIEKKFNKRVPVEKTNEYEAYFSIKIDTERSSYIVDQDFMVDLVKNFNTFSDLYSIVDIRSWNEFIGEVTGYSDLNTTGRIPDAVWGKAGSTVNQLEDYRNPDLTMRSADDVRKMWSELDIDYTNKHLIFYCGSGWRAAEVLIYAEVMGLKKISLYDGGWYEWTSNANNTIETGIPLLTTDILDDGTTPDGTADFNNQTTIANEQEATKSDDRMNTSMSMYTCSFNLMLFLNLAILGFLIKL